MPEVESELRAVRQKSSRHLQQHIEWVEYTFIAMQSSLKCVWWVGLLMRIYQYMYNTPM